MFQTGFSNIQIKKEDGAIYCRFTRLMTSTIQHVIEDGDTVTTQPITFDLSQHFYLLMSFGDIYSGTIKYSQLCKVKLHLM